MAGSRCEQAQGNVISFLNTPAGPQTANMELVIEAAQPSGGWHHSVGWPATSAFARSHKHLGRNFRCREPCQA